MSERHNCEICENGSQYKWRIDELEKKVGRLYNLLITTAISSFGTLIGIIVIYVTK